MWSKDKLRKVEESDLISLKDNQISETQTIEYKSILSLNNREEKREFLADVCSFANAQGGNLFFGITEKDGIPISINGINLTNTDSEILKIENLLRDGIEPRISGIEIFPIKLQNGNVVLAIYITNSYVKPHIVNFSGHWRFYSRNSAGKYPLDLSEVKTAIVKSETQYDAIKKFRLERFNRIISGDIAITMNEFPKMIFHLIPVQSFGDRNKFDVFNYFATKNPPKPISSSGWNHKLNFDGIISYSGWNDNQKITRTYVQLYKDGTIEAVDSTMFRIRGDEKKIIPSVAYERNILDALQSYLRILKELDVPPPFIFMLSFHGIRDYYLAVDERKFWMVDQENIDRNDLIIPEVFINDYTAEIDEALRPVFDSVWNAAGWDCSKNYDENGKWIGH